MPNRILKESITTSDTLPLISAEAERCFWRLVVLADDYGLYDGRPTTILGKGFTGFLGSVTAKHIERWLAELEAADLLHRYTVDGKPYLQLSTWERHQQRRATKSKYPQPPACDTTSPPLLASDSNRTQLLAHVPVNENENVIVNVNENEERGVTTPDTVSEVFRYYQEKVQPNARLIDAARQKIKTRLKTFDVAQLKEGIDRFASDSWRMENNAREGAAWFFDSDARSEKFLNLVPRAPNTNGQRLEPAPRTVRTL